MNLTEIIKNHPVIILAGIFASGVGLGWKVIDNVKVAPLEKRIVFLTQDTQSEESKIRSLENQIEELEGQLKSSAQQKISLGEGVVPGTESARQEREIKTKLSKYKAVCNSLKISNFFDRNENWRQQLMTHCE